MKRFLYICCILISFFAAGFAVAGFASGFVHPLKCQWLSFFGLVLMPVLALNFLIAILWLVWRSWWSLVPIGALVLNVGYLSAMFQVTLLDRNDGGKERIKMATYNVNNFYTNDVYTLSSVAEYMQDERVDLLCLQEFPSEGFYPRDSILQAFSYLPYSCLSNGAGNTLAMAIFSRYPVENCQTISYPGSSNLSLMCDLNIKGKKVRLFTNHLQTTSVNAHKSEVKESLQEGEGRRHAAFNLAWSMKDNFEKRADQADSIRALIKASPYPVIVCGDFNDTPASYAYHRIKGDLTDGFRDCGNGYGYTFREIRKLFRIDYIFYSSDLKGIRYFSPDFPWSDHKPVIWEGILRE